MLVEGFRIIRKRDRPALVEWGGFKMFCKNSVLVYQAEGAIFMLIIDGVGKIIIQFHVYLNHQAT